MFIIDHFEVTDPDGQKRQTEEEAVRRLRVHSGVRADPVDRRRRGLR